MICLGRKGDQSLRGEGSQMPPSLRLYWVQLTQRYIVHMQSSSTNIQKATVMKNWHHLQIIIGETQGLSLVRVCEICWLQKVIWSVYHEVGSFTPYTLSSVIWFIPTGLLLGRTSLKGNNTYSLSGLIAPRSCLFQYKAAAASGIVFRLSQAGGAQQPRD